MFGNMRSTTLRFAIATVLLASVSGCAGMSRTGKGAIIGATAGGVAGGVIGNNTGSTTRGAIIGAVVGGAAGALIGRHMDQQAAEIQQNIPGAVVERVGEGIQVTFPAGVLFDFDSDVVRSDARAHLNDLAKNLNKYDETNLMIAGHTDAKGSDSYNQRLSLRRAESAARYLASQGVQRHIATVGLGEREPLASNDTEDGRQRNRRVELAIYASAAAQEKARNEAGGR